MKKYILIGLLALLSATKLSAQKQNDITDFNLIFAPDLSNRLNPKLYPKAVSDADIVQGVLGRVWPDILRIKREEGQLDHYSVDFINKGLIGLYKINTDALAIDFQRFERRQSDRIDYIKARNKTGPTLKTDTVAFIAEYKKFNNKAAISNNGADIWTYFQSGIDDRIVLPTVSTGGKLKHKFRNVMVLMTDGYIEAGIYGKGYDLSAAKVTDFRNAFLKSNSDDMHAFLSKNPKFKIKPAKNPFLKDLEVIVMEMYDRSLSKTGAARKHPTDMEIMKLIWTDWMRSSGVKRFELKSTASNKTEAVKYIIDFLKKS
ncbi:hypothetical protein SAMN05421820_10496 [Pedobacter steynii]|uniref:Uncharacterized protein n=1 Tax=Pedobacter steynii TaxID=430522 RepID=A0A1G9U898_9SPHI|nr:hypothetical protein [Pedobacter steynii]NQX40692.1 hypothetical protein [Pedobacter steynii]SDM56171.1 hypothetical protein SAMN05421820_10496 [Pedobacter steynii]